MKKSLRAFLIFLVLIFLLIFAVSAYKLITIIKGYNEADAEYTDLSSKYTVAIIPGSAAVPDAEASGEETAPEIIEVSPITVDFEALLAENEDVVGWLYCEGTVINYPVLQGEDNNEYLHKLVNGRYNDAGSLFVDYVNMPDFSDYNTIIYGHRMNNGAMFASLREYVSQEYYEEHPVLYLNTPTQNYRVEVFSAYETPSTSEVYTIHFAIPELFEQYIAAARDKSDILTDVEVSSADHIVTFSTCQRDSANMRYVVQGKLVPIN